MYSGVTAVLLMCQSSVQISGFGANAVTEELQDFVPEIRSRFPDLSSKLLLVSYPSFQHHHIAKTLEDPIEQHHCGHARLLCRISVNLITIYNFHVQVGGDDGEFAADALSKLQAEVRMPSYTSVTLSDDRCRAAFSLQ